MGNQALIDLVRHNTWATGSILEFCRHLTGQQLSSSVTGVYGDVPATLHHIVTAEGAYLRRLAGDPPPWLEDAREAAEPAGLDQLEVWVADLDRRWERFLSEPFDADQIHIMEHGTESVRAGLLLAQVFHHGNAHREQICAILTSIGVSPPDVQAWEYGWQAGRIWNNDTTGTTAAT